MNELTTVDLSLAATKILECFRQQGLRAHGMIHPADFGDAVIWEAGFIRDEEVRKAWAEIITEGLRNRARRRVGVDFEGTAIPVRRRTRGTLEG